MSRHEENNLLAAEAAAAAAAAAGSVRPSESYLYELKFACRLLSSSQSFVFTRL